MPKAHTEQALAYASTGGSMAAGPQRPLRDLMRLLPALHPQAPMAPELQQQMASTSSAALRTIHLGLAALGQLVARCSLDLQDGTVGSESIENLGHLMAELGDLAGECMRIHGECRHACEPPTCAN